MCPVPNSPNQPIGPGPAQSAGYVVPQAHYVPPQYPPTRVVLVRSGLSRFGAWLGWILFIVALIWVGKLNSNYASYQQTNPQVTEQFVSHSLAAADKVAIIRVEGTIMHEDGYAKWQIDQALKDPAVKAVVLRVDSPGGTITGSNYIYHDLLKLKSQKDIQLVVSMGGIAASGGYYISMAVGDTPDTIFAEPSTWTGSIGVLIPHYDISGLLEKWNVTDDTIASNPLKLIGSPTRKTSPEIADKERAILQKLVDESFQDFKDIVKKGRPKFDKDPKTLDELATGQIYTAKQALADGLVDKLGYLEDAVDRAIELNKLDKDNVRVVRYEPPPFSFLNQVLGSNGTSPAGQAPRLDLTALLDLTAPRAYYLCSWFPSLISPR
jgi:protease-4